MSCTTAMFYSTLVFFFFFQAEDGIRDYKVTGVQTCALPISGCASLDALDRRLRDEFERARRYSLRFALVLLDIDRLREVNERLGQAAGDRVLAEFGAVMQREIRAPDFVARYGGDEFALILPETDGEGGRRFGDRLRQV